MRSAQLVRVSPVPMLQTRIEQNERNAAEDDEAARDEPEQGPALLAFPFFERVAAVASFPVRAIVRLSIDEVTEASENLSRVKPNEARVRGDEASHERFRRKIGIVIGLQRMQEAHVDLRCRGDLLDRDPSSLPFLPEKLAEGKVVFGHPTEAFLVAPWLARQASCSGTASPLRDKSFGRCRIP